MERKLVITGKGKLSLSPDILILTCSIEALEWEYEKSISTLNMKVEQLRQLLATEQIERKLLKTKDFDIRKSTIRNKQTDKYDFNGFKASHQLELELPLDKGLINRVLSKIAKNLNDLDFSISFGVKHPEQHQQELVLQAIEKAKEHATLIARASGVDLMEILHIDYSFREVVFRSRAYEYQMESADLLSTYEATPDFEPDDIDVAEHITIT